ncbi:MAG: hypothetical protein LAP87_13365 [Acidobacteriia bacterium]|nr:hypothetical protein [Terriglobia bacterium]
MDRLTGIVESLAGAVVAHDNQIEALVQIAEKHEKTGQDLRHRIEALVQIAEKHEQTWQDLQRQWQAYINTLPRQ